MRRMREPESAASVIRDRRLALELRHGYLDFLVRVLLIAAAGWILFTQVFLVTQAHGSGMFPAVKDGDLVIVFRMQKEYAAGDVVCVKLGDERHIVRISARENDVVMLDGSGTLTVNGSVQNGEILYPTYAKDGGPAYPYRVPEGSVFVTGDFRTQTEDSRDWGAVRMDQVEGKVITILRRRGI